MEKKPIQWHPGFQSALQVELLEDRDYLQFEKEYNLTKKPLQIDVLIKKQDGHQIEKSIGKIFRRYNVIEYKSPDDYVSINVFYKVMAYACLYQSDTEKVNEINPDELMITIVCSHYPREMIKYLTRRYETEIIQKYPGIYYLTKLLFPLQIVIIPQLSGEEYVWLSRLRGGLKLKEDIEPLARAYRNKEQNPLYQAVMDLIVRANKEKYEEGRTMCDALMELFADKLEEQKQMGREEGREEGREDGGWMKLVGQVRKKMGKGLTAGETADCLEETVTVIQNIYRVIEQYPETDDIGILQAFSNRKSHKIANGYKKVKKKLQIV